MTTVAEAEKRKRLLASALGVLAASLVGYQLWDAFGSGPTTPRPIAPVIVTATPAKGPVKGAGGPAAVKMGTTAAQLDPTLHMDAMLVTESLLYSGNGRNIFASGIGAPVKLAEIPKPVQGPRGPVVAQGPPPPPPPPPTCPPSCPAINLKFFGTATGPNGTRRAFLLNGDDVFVASAGDVVQRRYRVVSIAANSIVVEDLPNSNRQTLPLLGN
jgi:hypothetical protein